MKHGAFTFGFLLVAGMAGGVAFAGCSSSDDNKDAAADSGVTADTGAPDTKPLPDTAPPEDTGRVACEQKLPSTFACVEPTDRPGKTVCTDVMLQAFLNCFGTTGDSKKCTEAQTKYAACNQCVLKDWLTEAGRIDTAACFKKIDPTGTCGKTIQCTTDCLDTVCPSDECDDTPGSGTTATNSQADVCYTNAQRKPGGTKPTGQCWNVAVKDYATCNTDPKFAYCSVRSIADLLGFFRGACRDNGNWSKADQPDGSEDAGVAETGGSDTGAATDTGSAAADTGSAAADTGSAATDAADAG